MTPMADDTQADSSELPPHSASGAYTGPSLMWHEVHTQTADFMAARISAVQVCTCTHMLMPTVLLVRPSTHPVIGSAGPRWVRVHLFEVMTISLRDNLQEVLDSLGVQRPGPQGGSTSRSGTRGLLPTLGNLPVHTHGAHQAETLRAVGSPCVHRVSTPPLTVRLHGSEVK